MKKAKISFMVFMVFMPLIIIESSLASELVEVNEANNLRIEWYQQSTFTKASWIASIQNLNPDIDTDFDLNVILSDSSVDLKEIDNLKIYEWKNISYEEKIPIYKDKVYYKCEAVFYSNGTICYDISQKEIVGYNSITKYKLEWIEIKSSFTKEKSSDIIKENYNKINIPQFNSKQQDAAINGTKFIKIEFDKPIGRIGGNAGSKITLALESNGYIYHPVELSQCSFKLPITINPQNSSNITSRVLNVSIDMSSASAWTGSQHVMVDNSSQEVDYNISNPNTANAMLYFIANVSSNLNTTYTLYHRGASCLGTEKSIRGHDNKVNNVTAYITFNNNTVQNEINEKFGTFYGSAGNTSDAKYNSLGGNTSDQASSAINISNADLNVGNLIRPFSYELWFKPMKNYNSASGAVQILTRYDNAAGASLSLHYNSNEFQTENGYLVAFYRNSGGGIFNVSYLTTLETNRWYHILVVVPSDDITTGMKFYLNGTLIGESIDLNGELPTLNSRGLCIGDSAQTCNPDQGDVNRKFYGMIDEIRFYNINISVEDSLFIPREPILTVGNDINLNSAPTIPLLKRPNNAETLSDSTPMFEWFNSTDADGDPINYTLEIWNNTLMTQIAYRNMTITEQGRNQTNLTIPTALLDGTYYWRVNATDGSNSSGWSLNRSFDIGTTPSVTNPAITPLIVNNLTNINASTIYTHPTGASGTVDLIFYLNDIQRINVSTSGITNGTNITIIINHRNYSHFDRIIIGAYASDGTQTGSRKNSSTLTIINTPPTIPVNVTPIYNFTTTNMSVLLSCSGSSDLDNDTIFYEFWEDLLTNPPTTIRSNNTNTTLERTNLADSVHYWRCRSNDNASGTSDYNGTYNFTIDTSNIKTSLFGWALETYENAARTFTANITYNNLLIRSISAILTYNSTNYTAGIDNDGNGTKRFNATILIPFVSEVTNKTFNWTFVTTYYNTTTFLNLSPITPLQQRILVTTTIECLASNSTHEIIAEFPIQTEVNQTTFGYLGQVPNASIDATFKFWINNASQNKQINLNLINRSIFRLCGFPIGVNRSADAEISYSAQGYNNRQFHLRSEAVNATNIFNKTLHLLEDFVATATTFEILDENDEGLVGHYVELDRKDFDTSNYRTVAVLKTGVNGKGITYLQRIDATYRFKVFDYNKLLKTTGDTQVESGAIVLTINIAPATEGEVRKQFRDINYNLSWHNSTRTFSLKYTDTGNKTGENCMKIVRYHFDQGGVVYDRCSTAPTDTLNYTIPLSEANSRYVATYYSKINPPAIIETVEASLISSIADQLGLEGVFISFTIILTLALIGSFNPAVMVGGALLGIIFSTGFGFMNIEWNILIGIIIAGGILIYKMKT